MAVDIGGTFTDVVLQRGEKRWTTKVLTTPHAPENGFLRGVKKVLGLAGVTPNEVGMIIHGTTLGTNALIERKGAKTAFLTTAGFRDVLEIAHESRYELYDLSIEKPAPLVPRELRFTVGERISAAGRVLLGLDTEGIRGVIEALEKLHVQSLAIGFLQSFVNDSHERTARDLIAAAMPGLSISISSEVSPEIREYERFSTVCANAYIRPALDLYIGRLEQELTSEGFSCPLYLMSSGGSLTSPQVARAFPVRLIESGPAGGAILASSIATQCGIERMMAFDMGGTTAKLCFIDGGRPQTAQTFEAARVYRFSQGSGLPLRIPVIELVEIGAGGGSIGRVDEVGRLTVGPDSAGAEPGPACYGRGGRHATVTDADLLAGRLDAEKLASQMTVSEAAAGSALSALGAAFGWNATETALAIAETVEENMAAAARMHAIEGGRDVSAYTMLASGGAAPMHAARVAMKLGIDTVLIPSGAGVGSAIGFLWAPMAFESAETWIQTTSTLDVSAANERLQRQVARCRAQLPDSPDARASLSASVSLRMRYAGQGYEIEVPLNGLALGPAAPAEIHRQFEQTYERLYGLRIPRLASEIVSWKVRVALAESVQLPKDAVKRPQGRLDPPRLSAYLDPAAGTHSSLGVFERDRIAADAVMCGPAIIAEAETTTFVPRGWSAFRTAAGHLMLQNDGARQ
ncbi:MAG: hydantoinase/oxoprolinase family protein [Lautropia sp.]